MDTPKARISGEIFPGAKIYVSVCKGVLTTDRKYANADYPDAIGVIEGAVMKLTELGEKILSEA